MSARHRGSKDRNHDELADAFRALGCTVVDLHDANRPGFPDVLVGCIGSDHLVEFKNPETAYGRAGMTAEQSVFARDWRGGSVSVATCSEDVVALVSRWRKDPYLKLPQGER